ncbi:MAG: hypothetical protein ACM31C_21485 [Acidobacteriota bacterium]
MWRASLVLACACNQTFGLNETRLRDASAPDAPPSCPTQGAPLFSSVVHQIVFQHCIDYTLSRSAGRALALCADPGGPGYHVADGPLDMPLSPSAGLETLTYLDGAVLEPDGNAALVYAYDGTSAAWRRYVRDNAGQWTLAATFALPAMAITAPTTGATPHIFGKPTSTFEEYVADGNGGWTVAGTYTLQQLGVTANADHPTWTSDGLQLLLYDQLANNEFAIAYTQRASLADRFGPVTYLDSLAAYARNDSTETAAYGGVGAMTDDCGRFYFSALSSVFYVQQ